MTNPAFRCQYQPPAVNSIGVEEWPGRQVNSTSRMLTALRVLTTFYRFGETATLEDVYNVRKWAGDETLSTTDAAVVVVRQALEAREARGVE